MIIQNIIFNSSDLFSIVKTFFDSKDILNFDRLTTLVS